MRVISSLFLLLLLLSCSRKEAFVTKCIGGLCMKARLIASDEIASRFGEEAIREVNNSWYVLFSIGPDSEKGYQFDITRVDIEDKEEYNLRMEQLNFGMKELVYLEKGGERIAPTLYTMENTYGMNPWRDFVFVFPKEEGEQALSMVYNDEIFLTGINKFNFSKN